MTSMPADAGVAQQAELQALRTMLTFSRGTFSLSFAVCNSPALRDFLIDLLRRDCPGLHVQTISPGCTDILAEAASPVGPDDLPGLFLAGLESCVSSSQTDHPILRVLNASREAWAGKFRCPVVFWVPEYVMRILYRQARDLMAWRSHQFEFGPEPADLGRADSLSVLDDSLAANLSFEEKRFRIAELEGRIAQVGPDIPEMLVPHVASWMLELATLREVLGDLAAAREELGKAVDLLDRPSSQGAMGDDVRGRLRAMAMGRIAGILQARGELDEALRILREEDLPVFERLGDVRSRAVAMSKIADILDDRGELDEALRIRREEVLPAFERLGDVRSLAVTMGRIADILQARGELDEALRIRREEELPVYERLGDVRERAVTMGKIADIIQARGELDEALRILRDETLPVYERLGDVRDLLVGRMNLALTLLKRGRPEDRAEARRLLEAALAAAGKLRIPEEKRIQKILDGLG
jgi:tetratricopeptide (TPR) repeat protein